MTNSKKKTALGPLKPFRKSVILAPGLKVIECITELLVPFVVRWIIDEGLTETGSHYQDTPFILWLGLSIFGMAIIGFSATMVTQYVASKTSTGFAVGLRKQIYEQMLTVSDAQLEAFGKSKALNLVNADAFSLQTGVQMFMRLLVRAPFLVIGSMIASFIVHPLAGVIVLSALALCAVTILIILKITPKHYAALSKELDRISTLGDDGITGARVIRAFGKEERMQESFSSSATKYRKKAIFIAKLNSFINPLTFFFINASIILILVLGSYSYQNTYLSVGSIVALVSFLTQSLTALIQFTRLVTSLSKALASKKRIDAFMAIEPELVGGEIKNIPIIHEGETMFDFSHVDVSFGGEAKALDDITFTIKKGERVGVIGGTGSGKTTLLRLFQRYIDPSDGVVSFGGTDIKDFNLESLREVTAMVTQKPQIFKGTVEYNLTLGKEYPKEAIYKAMLDSLVAEFLPLNDDGLQKEVEEGGSNFSGGQKQRLLLCRAILASRQLLILDDSTSALDYRSDRLVRQNIKEKGVTTVIVSQRASSVLDCDQIIVLEHGKIVGHGKHDDLLKNCEIYREIYQAQVSQA